MISSPASQFSSVFKEAFRAVTGSKCILLATHEHPDADGLGSMLAVHAFLKERGVMSIPFCKDPPSDKLTFFPHINDLRQTIPSRFYDAIFGFDYGDTRRLGIPEEVIARTPLFITFDHHLVGETRGDIKVVDAAFSSTSEIVYWFFKENDVAIDRDIAILILSGIIADTGGFKHITTTPTVFEIAGELLGTGILPSKIISSILAERGDRLFPIWGRVLARLKKHDSIDMAFSFVLQEDFKELGATFDDVSGVIALINTVSDARFSLLLVEEVGGRVKGSLRSERYKGVDVAEIAKVFGGGGHKYAAGFTREGGIESVLKEVEENLGKRSDVMI